MSGIFGVVCAHHQADIGNLLPRMEKSLRYRNWQVIESEVVETGIAGLGRAGIGIFNKANQPIWNADRTIALVMAGEFYHYEELPETLPDEEVALRLYARHGAAFVENVQGIFTIAIWDERIRTLTIVNDRHGAYPLYYAYFNGKLVFAPEMKSIFQHSDFQKKIDMVAVAEYVRFQFLLDDKTFFEDVRLLPNGSILTYNAATDRLDVNRYWDISQVEPAPPGLSFEEAAEEAGRLLKNAINRLYRKDSHRVGMYCSGGLDSRANLGLLDPGSSPITTITYGPPQCCDVIYARELASRYKADHHYFEMTTGEWVKEFAPLHLDLTEGFHSWIHSHGISVGEKARQLMDVNITGFGGEEYDWDDDALFAAPDRASFILRLYRAISQEATWPSITDAEERMVFDTGIAPKMIGLAFDSYMTEMRKIDHLTPQQQIAYVNTHDDRRMYMYYTVFNRLFIEQRFPYLDYAYFDFIYAIPPQMTFDRRLRRAILLKLAPLAAKVPYDRDSLPLTGSKTSRLLRKGVQRTKQAVNRHIAPVFQECVPLYADYENWLRGELRDWGQEILLNEHTLQRGIFSPDFLRSIWQRHQSGYEPDMIGKVAPLMTLELLFRRHMDE